MRETLKILSTILPETEELKNFNNSLFLKQLIVLIDWVKEIIKCCACFYELMMFLSEIRLICDPCKLFNAIKAIISSALNHNTFAGP